MVFTEGHLTIIIGATEAVPTTTLLIDRLKPAQYTHTHTHTHTCTDTPHAHTHAHTLHMHTHIHTHPEISSEVYFHLIKYLYSLHSLT